MAVCTAGSPPRCWTTQVRPGVRGSIEIVGVVAHAAYAALRDPLRPPVYVPAGYKGQARC